MKKDARFVRALCPTSSDKNKSDNPRFPLYRVGVEMFDSIWFYVTEACNLRCTYCFNPKGMFDHPKTIKMDDYKKMLDNVLIYNEATNGEQTLDITLFGGEPMLYPELIEQMVEYAGRTVSGDLHFLLITNGVLLPRCKDLIVKLCSNYNFCLQLSIDSDPAIASDRCSAIDPLRYKKDIESTLDLLIDNDLGFSIRSTLCPFYAKDYFHNFAYFSDLFERNMKIKPALSIMPEFIHYRWREEDLKTVEKQIEKIVLYVKELYEKKDRLIMEHHIRIGLKNSVCRHENRENKATACCGFSGCLFAVSPEGKLFACHRLYQEPEMEVGDMLNNIIDWDRIEAIRSIYNSRGMIKPHPGLGIADCSECDIRYVCSAICPAHNFKRNDHELDVYCNDVMYHCVSLFSKYVEEHLWPLYENDEEFRERVKKVL